MHKNATVGSMLAGCGSAIARTLEVEMLKSHKMEQVAPENADFPDELLQTSYYLTCPN